eukprot:2642924-Lingulodinium_polyedra.AAC.1
MRRGKYLRRARTTVCRAGSFLTSAMTAASLHLHLARLACVLPSSHSPPGPNARGIQPATLLR